MTAAFAPAARTHAVESVQNDTINASVHREDEWNAVFVAKTPTMDGLKTRAPNHWRTVRAHGTAVGLPSDDDMGNSEVGHNALGAGQVIAQGAKLVDNAIADGSVFTKVREPHGQLHSTA